MATKEELDITEKVLNEANISKELKQFFNERVISPLRRINGEIIPERINTFEINQKVRLVALPFVIGTIVGKRLIEENPKRYMYTFGLQYDSFEVYGDEIYPYTTLNLLLT